MEGGNPETTDVLGSAGMARKTGKKGRAAQPHDATTNPPGAAAAAAPAAAPAHVTQTELDVDDTPLVVIKKEKDPDPRYTTPTENALPFNHQLDAEAFRLLPTTPRQIESWKSIL